MSSPHDPSPMAEHAPDEGVRITDRRRIDPVTGQARPAPAGDPPAGATDPVAGGPSASEDEGRINDLTADLQRVTAEYANYRRRVERDRAAQQEAAVASALTGLLPVLDDIGRARAHGDLSGAFAVVAEQLTAALSRLGLAAVGQPGEEFDPAQHEALSVQADEEADRPVVAEVVTPGYRVGERLLRPALVVVRQPSQPGELPQAEEPEPLTGEPR